MLLLRPNTLVARSKTFYNASSSPFRTLQRAGLTVVAVGLIYWCLYGVWHLLRITSPAALSWSDGIDASGAANQPVVLQKARLHLLIPATSSNEDLCKLMLSAQILGYPTPVLINYGDVEDDDPYVQHLAKVDGILRYLNRLENSEEYAEDLVLIIDGFDVWFQLRPDVLIQRYYALNHAADQRLLRTYGSAVVNQTDMRQTVVFGPDKLCWPVNFRRPACWAVATTALDSQMFGPETARGDRDFNLPQWLNSGTVLGPAADLRRFFNATLARIHDDHSTDSDQFYFSNLFGEQEYARLTHNPEMLEQAKSIRYNDFEDSSERDGDLQRDEPDLTGKQTEYHVGLDYSSTLFQTLAMWKLHLTWVRAADSWLPPAQAGSDSSLSQYYNMTLPEDIQRSRPPLDMLSYSDMQDDSSGAAAAVAAAVASAGVEGGAAEEAKEAKDTAWADVELHYNALTRQFPVMLHFTGEKRFRHVWWAKVWFQTHARALREAAGRADQRQISPEPIAGLLWFIAEPSDDAAEDIALGGKGGVWTDRGGWMSWKTMCKAAEDVLYSVPGDADFHPAAHLVRDEGELGSPEVGDVVL